MRHQRGLGVVETLLSLVLGNLVLVAALSTFSSLWQSHTTVYGNTRLTQELYHVMDFMTNELRRAGSRQMPLEEELPKLLVTNLVAGQWQTDNPFGEVTLDNGGGCVLFAYDLPPENNQVDASETPSHANEKLGFRLNTETAQIEMRTGGKNIDSCSSVNNHWEAVTSRDIKITQLKIEKIASNGQGSAVANKRVLHITMQATLRQQPMVKAKLVKTVYLRNDMAG